MLLRAKERWVLLALLGIASWMSEGSAAEACKPPPPGLAIYQRATNQLEAVNLLKPGGTNDEDLTFRLAPFIFQEVGASAGNVATETERARDVVHVHADTVELRGKMYTRLAYLWSYPSEPPGKQISAMQAVRLTLNSAGEPVIWEVLSDTSGMELIFVSEKLEAASRAEFGPPLPGRRHSIEAPMAQAPNVVVARVLDDGPVPMGPIVYLKDPTHDVLTVICRCMPAQAKKLILNRAYELRPWAGVPARRQSTAFWPGEPDRPLELRLRLPSKF